MSFFGDLEEFASGLYPYRWPITIGAALLLAAAVAVAYRRGWHLAIWRHKPATVAVLVPLLVIAIPAGWYTLSPLWERSHLEEASPLAVAAGEAVPAADDAAPAPPAASPSDTPPDAPAPTTEPALEPFEPRVTHRGEFRGADDFHFGRGQALLIETAPGRYTLRFEDFSVRNGPDLFVYLSPSEDGGFDGAVNLGGLKATDGTFNYDIPPEVDVSQFNSAIVWCRQFSVLFAVAPLAAVQ